MIAPLPVPQAEFTHYLLQQSGLRASLLKTSFGLARNDWDDLRQEMAVDCIRRLPKYDASRGDWKGFVRGVVRNQACALASRQVRRPQFLPLEYRPGFDERLTSRTDEPAEDLRPVWELNLDTERVLFGLPDDLRTVARYLAEMPMAAVLRKTGLTIRQLKRGIRQMRAAFVNAGLAPANYSGKGDRR